ncbi:MAG: Fur family transcriptional regulator [Pseudomonadota bacterium]
MEDAQLISGMRSKGLKVTPQRRLVCQILDQCDSHPDAREIHRLALGADEHISPGTVYRILHELEKHELIWRHEFGGGRSRYEKADPNRHDHLIDKETGCVVEFDSEIIQNSLREIAAAQGFELVNYELNLFCVKAKTSRTKAVRKAAAGTRAGVYK